MTIPTEIFYQLFGIAFFGMLIEAILLSILFEWIDRDLKARKEQKRRADMIHQAMRQNKSQLAYDKACWDEIITEIEGNDTFPTDTEIFYYE